MMTTLAERLLTDEVRPGLVVDCARFINDEVQGKRGLSGMAIKGVFKTLRSMKPDFVPDMVDGLLDDWIVELEPCWENFQREGGASFSLWLSEHRQDVAGRLLRVTDVRAEHTPHATLRKFYLKLRPKAAEQVSSAVPGLGRVVERHLV